jgi:hypothetical protein
VFYVKDLEKLWITAHKGSLSSGLFAARFGRDAVQHVTEPQAQCIGKTQADDKCWRALPFLDFPYGRAFHAGQSAELLQGYALTLSFLPQFLYSAG